MWFFLKHKTLKMAKMRVCLYKTLLETTFFFFYEAGKDDVKWFTVLDTFISSVLQFFI